MRDEHFHWSRIGLISKTQAEILTEKKVENRGGRVREREYSGLSPHNKRSAARNTMRVATAMRRLMIGLTLNHLFSFLCGFF